MGAKLASTASCAMRAATIRRAAKGGFGATPPAEAEPDLEVPDLESLVHALGLRGS
jgi:hypothetical protein